jgi:glucose/arabinose dehydrogenase
VTSNPHRFHRALALLLASAFAGGALEAATSCKTQSCGGSCSPAPPVELSVLIDSADFPALPVPTGNSPTAFVDPTDGRSRRLISTQQGVIWVWDGATGTILPTPFLDLRDDVGGPVLNNASERGLLALAVDPEYAETGELYVFYSAADSGPIEAGDIVIARYARSAGNPDVGDPASATVLLVINHPATNHNGGWLAFGPDGFLYISTGDGGGFCDGNAGTGGDGQSASTLAGKMLRIDVRDVDPGAGPPDDCQDGGTTANYEVPSTNPFFNQEPACDEVWALGLRNPFRFSFDRATGDLYVGDVGQDNWEEINLQRAATAAPVNWGWVCREGCAASSVSPSSCSTAGCPVDGGATCEFPRGSGFWDPILCHSNPQGWSSIMGGYRYRGELVPSIAGDYFYGDAGCGQIWKTTVLDPANPAAIDAACWQSQMHGTYGFAEDHLGELYVVVGGAGRIECIHDGAGCYWAGWAGLFEDDFETGDTSRWSSTAN